MTILIHRYAMQKRHCHPVVLQLESRCFPSTVVWLATGSCSPWPRETSIIVTYAFHWLRKAVGMWFMNSATLMHEYAVNVTVYLQLKPIPANIIEYIMLVALKPCSCFWQTRAWAGMKKWWYILPWLKEDPKREVTFGQGWRLHYVSIKCCSVTSC